MAWDLEADSVGSLPKNGKKAAKDKTDTCWTDTDAEVDSESKIMSAPINLTKEKVTSSVQCLAWPDHDHASCSM